MVHHTQKVKNATCDWFRTDGSHIMFFEQCLDNQVSNRELDVAVDVVCKWTSW